MAKNSSISKAHKKANAYALQAQEHKREAQKNLHLTLGIVVLLIVLLAVDLILTNMGYMQNGFVDFNLFVMIGLFMIIFIGSRYFERYRTERRAYKRCIEGIKEL